MCKSKIHHNIDQYSCIQDIDDKFIDLCKNLFSKDTLYYPVFLSCGLVNMKTVVNKAGFGRVAKNSKTRCLSNLGVSSHDTIYGSFDIFKHELCNNKYMLKCVDLAASTYIFIEYTETELIKTYLYKDGTKIVNKAPLTPESN